jgi:hypothetical protein
MGASEDLERKARFFCPALRAKKCALMTEKTGMTLLRRENILRFVDYHKVFVYN